MPSEKRSLRPSSVFSDVICSGAMHGTVPTVPPLVVRSPERWNITALSAPS